MNKFAKLAMLLTTDLNTENLSLVVMIVIVLCGQSVHIHKKNIYIKHLNSTYEIFRPPRASVLFHC